MLGNCLETCLQNTASCNIDDACVFNAPRIVVHFLNLSKSLSKECYARQPAATRERRLLDARHADRYCNACQTVAAGERINTDAFYTLRNSYAHKIVTVRKRIIPDICHVARYCYACQTGDVFKSILPNVCNILSNLNCNYVIWIFNLPS